MKSILCFVAGFGSCLLLGIGVSGYSQWSHPNGKITYRGEGVVWATDGAGEKYQIDQSGCELPYGNYKVELKNGKTVSILKNNKSNVGIEEDGGAVLVYGDENTVWATLNKKASDAQSAPQR